MTLGVQNEPGIKITMTRPSTQEVLDKIAAGTLVAHPTRQPLQKKDVTTMMGTTATSTPARWSGGWNEEAQRRLETFLANPKRSAEQLALEDRKPEGKMPEDKKSSSDSSSSGSSSSDSDDSSDEAPKGSMFPTTRLCHGSWSCQGQAEGESRRSANLKARRWGHLQCLMPYIFGAREVKHSDWSPQETHWRPDKGECHVTSSTLRTRHWRCEWCGFSYGIWWWGWFVFFFFWAWNDIWPWFCWWANCMW